MIIKITDSYHAPVGVYNVKVDNMDRFLNGTILYVEVNGEKLTLLPWDYLRIKEKTPWRKILKAKGYKKKTLKKYDWYIRTAERWEYYEKNGRRVVSSIKYVGIFKYYETELIKQGLRKGEL